jgi:hypothetical protein
MPVVADGKLQDIIKNLYKGTGNPKRTGDGTTMDAVRNELLTGRRTHWTRHIQKAEQTKRDLANWVERHPDASARDIRIARALMKRLTNALNTKRPS